MLSALYRPGHLGSRLRPMHNSLLPRIFQQVAVFPLLSLTFGRSRVWSIFVFCTGRRSHCLAKLLQHSSQLQSFKFVFAPSFDPSPFDSFSAIRGAHLVIVDACFVDALSNLLSRTPSPTRRTVSPRYKKV